MSHSIESEKTYYQVQAKTSTPIIEGARTYALEISTPRRLVSTIPLSRLKPPKDITSYRSGNRVYPRTCTSNSSTNGTSAVNPVAMSPTS